MKLKLLLVFLFQISLCYPGFSAELARPASLPADSINIKEAFRELRNLPAKERRQKLKEAKKAIKDFKKAKRAGEDTDVNTLLLVILALILPPLAVYLHQGETNSKFWITTLLFVLGLIGAFAIGWYLILASIVYALIVILGNK